ncbi:UDP-N-acetylenolpyruvoylglucosamine reductase [Ralstonia condita]|jgi:UDP-N-acetylmuramate dehydrogenase|uniref:UDP-N-acetylenolpyruvoylglucosamine reductase n=1 Tax=Ralstonia condita TaxID=3058600 RepID=A0ABM9IWU0_9RALS|nr:UDP-N-acetylmuramate dehydrogenase [Ralstonia sp. LMG 7141]MDE2202785.1 UDP-N-acetylmuramate dehydrogenase [Burkholderiaceae bacterium]CAJ0774731.1 UDP-N-acetylenolpyruvoylglucosamine reductase [Ralstonia sp. LMG 7141]
MASLDTHYPLGRHNTFRFEAAARYATHVRTPEDIPAALDDPRVRGLPVLVLGGGSNVVLTRDFDGLVLLMEIPGVTVAQATVDGRAVNLVTAGGGESWHGLVSQTVAQGLPGLENLALIPGTVGAAPIQNIGAYGIEIKDRFHSLRAYDRHAGEFVALRAADCAFGYRDSIFKRAGADRYIITEVTFALPADWQPETHYAELARELTAQHIAKPTAQDIFDAVVTIRRRKLPDPADIGNAGSFFKNPIVDAATREALAGRFPNLVGYAQPDGTYKLAAGWLIDQCGFKGRQSGAVGVYEKQALVLVNRGGGSAVELMTLAREIQDSVYARFGVRIEPEPVVI